MTTTEPNKPLPTLSDEQSLALTTILEWFSTQDTNDSRPCFKLGGYAGTGKTTLIRAILAHLREKNEEVSVAAFTGKAVNVLRRKGVHAAQTLHSLIYHAEKSNGIWHFYRKVKLEKKPSLIIVDEASMLSTDLYEDLSRFNIPVLYVGDPGQLEPVGKNPELMKEPDFVLQTIHRQAAQSPIISIANHIRQGGGFRDLEWHEGIDGSKVFVSQGEPTNDTLLRADQVICAKNATRREYNTAIRFNKGFTFPGILVGEKLICLKNNQEHALFNGMVLFVDSVKDHPDKVDRFIVTMHDEVGGKYEDIDVWKEPFRANPKYDSKNPAIPKGCVFCDYGYCITCHKSQGSEWQHVLVVDEWMPPQVWDMKRWRYTAITRAAKELSYYL
jgi:exodeoxyribonuclease-5